MTEPFPCVIIAKRVCVEFCGVALGWKGPCLWPQLLAVLCCGFLAPLLRRGICFLFLASRHTQAAATAHARRWRKHKHISFALGVAAGGLHPRDRGEALPLLRLMVAGERHSLQWYSHQRAVHTPVSNPRETHRFIKNKTNKTPKPQKTPNNSENATQCVLLKFLP